MRTRPLHRQAAVAVGQGRGHPPEPLLGPGGLGQRAIGIDRDALTLDVDLAGLLPVPTDRGIVQPSIVGSHLAERVIEKDAYDFLRDVPVDQPGSKSVAPLMGRQMYCTAVFVLDVAPLQPAIELAPVGVRGQGPSAVGVHPWRREHNRLPPGQRSSMRCCWAAISPSTSSSMGTRASRFIFRLR